MFEILTVFLILCSSLNTLEDPAIGDIQFTDENIISHLPSTFIGTSSPIIPPELNLTLTSSANQETIYVSFTSSQVLYAGWIDTTFCSTYPNWNYWWLNTRLGIDDLDSIYVLTSLYNYSSSNYNFHKDVLDYAGTVINQDPEWNGYQMQPIIEDGLENNHYIGHTLMGWSNNMDDGAVDELNYIYSSKASGSGDIFFTLLDSIGNYVFNQTPVASGDTANSWSGDSHLAIDSSGNIYICWSRDMHEIVYSMSTDGGATWLPPKTIASDFSNQVNKPEMLISPDNHIHFIWQHWTGSHNHLMYKKLYPDGSCCVDTTNLTPTGSIQAWSPDFTMDPDTNIHIVWSPSHQGSSTLYYTLIDGKLDKSGLPSTDTEITIIQEYGFYSNAEKKRYPKVITDSLCCPGVIFDQGEYGTHNTKTVYFIKQTLPPQGIIVFQDSSIYKLDIDTVGGYTASFVVSDTGNYFVKVWAWNEEGELGWDTASVDISLGISEDIKYEIPSLYLDLFPVTFNQFLNIKFATLDNEEVNLKIYDLSGRSIRTLIPNQIMTSNSHSIYWDGTDDSGNKVNSGVYIVYFSASTLEGNYRFVKYSKVTLIR